MIFGCVYVVTNAVTGKIYVGQTTRTVQNRWSVHKSEAARRPQSYFHKSVAKHGPEAFTVAVVAVAGSSEELDRLECEWIANTRSHDPSVGYNLTHGGERGMRTQAACRNNAAARRGKPLSLETIAKMSAVRRGRKQSEAHKRARSLALKGRAPSAAARLAVAESNRRRARPRP